MRLPCNILTSYGDVDPESITQGQIESKLFTLLGRKVKITLGFLDIVKSYYRKKIGRTINSDYFNSVIQSYNKTIRNFVKENLASTSTKFKNFYESAKKSTCNTWKSFLNKVGVKRAFSVGEVVADVTINRIRNGTLNKVAIIGRDMTYVRQVAKQLKDEGENVEILDVNYLPSKFNLNGVEYSLEQLVSDLRTNPSYIRNSTGYVIDSDLPNTLLFKANKQWVEKLRNELKITYNEI